MEYVFGSTLVCDTLDNAKKVAFDQRVKTKTVTLGGDIFDPQGTLSGGERGRVRGGRGGGVWEQLRLMQLICFYSRFIQPFNFSTHPLVFKMSFDKSKFPSPLLEAKGNYVVRFFI
jgi:hypothetical protein